MPLLFSYGTLQQPSVQFETFGRLLPATADELVGFQLSTVHVQDSQFVASTGKAIHANVVFVGGNDGVIGTVFELTDLELSLCDEYERPARYRRLLARVKSGREVWVYAHWPGDR
jgi:gamma-glutamylcyclotransferase (GGCT)/AIG2-like uncharacterized protein YtfP